MLILAKMGQQDLTPTCKVLFVLAAGFIAIAPFQFSHGLVGGLAVQNILDGGRRTVTTGAGPQIELSQLDIVGGVLERSA